MARGRMISKTISLDELVNSLSNDTVRLLFTWLIPHLDCEGRTHGDATTVKSIVFPRRNIRTSKIEKYLQELETLGLILRYSVNGNVYLLAPNFEKHQTGLQKNREAQSQIPPFTPELLQSNSGLGHSEVKVKVKGVSPPKVGDTRIKEILDKIADLQSYKIAHYPKEAASVKRGLTLGYTPDQIIGCWEKMKREPFWKGKALPLAKVVENLGEYAKGGDRVAVKFPTVDELMGGK